MDNQLSEIEKIAQNDKVVAIGEIGLDYHWNKLNKDLQKKVFIKQIELANKLNLPIVIHTREAVMDTLDILKNVCPTTKPGVFHCCPLNVELVKEALKLGFYISFAGPVTFKNSKNAEEIVKMVPLDRMLIETDSPYLAPEPVRGSRNDSRNVRYIAEKIAEFKGVDVEVIAEATYKNALDVFKIN
ncbi:MAG: TatD family hydrolase [Clostridia bacterium]|nr:TatD family hydrolase [Clostridia bacterium]